MAEMKVTNEKDPGFYISAATSFLCGVEAKEATEGKDAVEAKAAVETLTITALGEAINVAMTVATELQADSIGKIKKVEETKDDGGCAQITITMRRLGGGAPYLHKCTLLDSEFQRKLIVEIMADNPVTNPDEDVTQYQNKLKALMLPKRTDWYENVATPLLKESFKFHDRDGNGILDKEESSIFIGHVVEETSMSMRDSLAKTMDALLPQLFEACGGLIPSDPAGQDIMTKTIMPAVVKLINNHYKLVINREYYERQDECHAGAFKLMDTNCDGKIQLSEFLSALSPAKEDELLAAIGIDQSKIIEEVIQKGIPELIELIQREAAKMPVGKLVP